MFGAPPKPESRPCVTVDELPSPSICSVEPMNMSTAYWPASWHSTRLERSDAVAAGEEDVGRARDVALHARLRRRSSARCSTQPVSIAGISVGCGLSVQWRQILPLQAELLAVGRQDQFDRGRVEADAVIERLHLMALVDAANRHHRHQDLHSADVARVAREERLDEERLVGLRPRSRPTTPGMSTRGRSLVVDDFVDLRDHDAVAERGGFDERRRVLGVRAGVEVAVAVGLWRRTAAPRSASGRRTAARTARRRCGSRRSRACRPPGTARCAGSARRRTRSRASAAMPRSNRSRCSARLTPRDHQVQVVDELRGSHLRERARQEIRLLLVVALQHHPVAGPSSASSASIASSVGTIFPEVRPAVRARRRVLSARRVSQTRDSTTSDNRTPFEWLTGQRRGQRLIGLTAVAKMSFTGTLV